MTTTSSFTGVPIVFGVTGHRDVRPEDVPKLLGGLNEVIAKFRERFPTSPFKLLTMLAPGADQLAAQAFGALEKGRTEPEEGHYEVVAPLPCPVEVYEASSSFSPTTQLPNLGTEGLAEFRRWIRKKEIHHFVVPYPGSPASDKTKEWNDVMGNEDSRHACYANAGVYIADHCHILLALWDSEEEGGNSGTWEILNYKLTGAAPKRYHWFRWLNRGSEPGPVVRIYTPREKANDTNGHQELKEEPGNYHVKFNYWKEIEVAQTPFAPPDAKSKKHRISMPMPMEYAWKAHGNLRTRRPEDAVVTARFLHALGWTRKHHERPLTETERKQEQWYRLHEICDAVEAFNVDSDELATRERWAKRYNDGMAKDGNQALLAWSASLAKSQPQEHFQRALESAVKVRQMASVISERIEAEGVRTLGLLYAFVLVAGFFNFGLLHSSSAVWERCGLACYFASFAVMVGLVVAAWHRRQDERRLDYRALAETLRVRLFWAVAGIDKSVANSYLSQLQGEITWVRLALKTLVRPTSYWKEVFQPKSTEEKVACLKLARDHWVVEQVKYYRGSSLKKLKGAIYFNRVAFALTVLGFVASIIDALRMDRSSLEETWLSWSVALGSNLFLFAGVLAISFSERRSYAELESQYERMLAVFKQGRDELHRTFGELEEAHASGDPTAVDEAISNAQQTLIALGEEAISEHSEWLILRRNRPIEAMLH